MLFSTFAKGALEVIIFELTVRKPQLMFDFICRKFKENTDRSEPSKNVCIFKEQYILEFPVSAELTKAHEYQF